VCGSGASCAPYCWPSQEHPWGAGQGQGKPCCSAEIDGDGARGPYVLSDAEGPGRPMMGKEENTGPQVNWGGTGSELIGTETTTPRRPHWTKNTHKKGNAQFTNSYVGRVEGGRLRAGALQTKTSQILPRADCVGFEASTGTRRLHRGTATNTEGRVREIDGWGAVRTLKAHASSPIKRGRQCARNR